ncbi:hypothetical protein McaMca56_003401 [Microsporum canis]
MPVMLLYIFEGASYPVVEISLNTEFPKLPAMTETLVSIPYTAANLPGPLPTKSQIESAPVLSQRGDTKIVKVDDKYAVKYGPAAQFFFFEADAESEMNYMVMEYIEGQTLKSCWDTLSDAEKEDIAATLKQYFTELRSLPSPGYYGFLGRRPFESLMFETMEPNPAINGPFETEEDLNEGMILSYASRRPKHRAAFMRRALATTFHGHEPKFTHADFQCKNIIVRKTGCEDGKNRKRMYEVTVIDWEEAGWYPSYWEYTVAAHASDWQDDWPNWLAKMMDPYDLEFAWVDMIHQSYYGGL